MWTPQTSDENTHLFTIIFKEELSIKGNPIDELHQSGFLLGDYKKENSYRFTIHKIDNLYQCKSDLVYLLFFVRLPFYFLNMAIMARLLIPPPLATLVEYHMFCKADGVLIISKPQPSMTMKLAKV